MSDTLHPLFSQVPEGAHIRQSSKSPTDDGTRFFLPGEYIPDMPSTGNLKANAAAEFHWMMGCQNPRWAKAGSEDTIPIGGTSKMWLSGYVHFKYPPGGDGSGVAPVQAALDRVSGISWVMNNSSFGSIQPGSNFRSVHFRGSITDFSIPSHAAEFFTLLLRDVRRNWDKIFSDSESLLDQRVCQPLPTITLLLLAFFNDHGTE